jgi:hypothetical protein
MFNTASVSSPDGGRGRLGKETVSLMAAQTGRSDDYTNDI